MGRGLRQTPEPVVKPARRPLMSQKPGKLEVKIKERSSPTGAPYISWNTSSGSPRSGEWIPALADYFHQTMRELVETGALNQQGFFDFKPVKINPEEDDFSKSYWGESRAVSNRRILDAYETEFIKKRGKALREVANQIAENIVSQLAPYEDLEADLDTYTVYIAPNWPEGNEI